MWLGDELVDEDTDLAECIDDRPGRIAHGIGRASRRRQEVVDPETDDEQHDDLLDHTTILDDRVARGRFGAPLCQRFSTSVSAAA